MNISIIISVRNEGAAFARTLDYLEEQRPLHDLEVVIVDDASDPPVGNLPDGFLLIRNETRLGIARSRNRGARLATGDTFLITDGHVFFSDNALSDIVSVCDDQGIVGCKTQLIYNDAQFARRQMVNLHGVDYYGWRFALEPEVSVVPNLERLSDGVYELPYVGGGFLAIRQSLFWALGGFDEGLIQCGSIGDAELAMKCWAFGYSVRLAPWIACYHYTAPQTRSETRRLSPLDVPRYEGSFQNALRVMYLHFPEALFSTIAERLQIAFPASWAALDPRFPDADLRARRDWLDTQRRRDREWLVERMTRIHLVES